MATAGKNLSEYDRANLPDAREMSIGIVVSEWNEHITENLYQGALHTLIACGVPVGNIHRLNVPGSFELVYGCRKMQHSTYAATSKLRKKSLDAVIAIGAVIRGETAHFDFVCQGVTQGIKDLNLNKTRIPVIFCVLTDDTLEQSIARSGGMHGNKGDEAAIAAIKMAAIKNL